MVLEVRTKQASGRPGDEEEGLHAGLGASW
jgi:hypothetical protein